MKLSIKEKQSIRVLNFAATYDGIMSNNEIKWMLRMGIEKFICKSRRHLVSITKTAHPRIKINKTIRTTC